MTCDPAATGSSILTGAAQVGAVLSAGSGVPQITIDAVTGDVDIVATFGNAAVTTLTGYGANSLACHRTGSTDSWDCSSTTPPQYAPRGCN